MENWIEFVFLKEKSVDPGRHGRINKAYKLIPDKLGCFASYDVNKPIFLNVLFVQTRPSSQASPLSRGMQ